MRRLAALAVVLLSGCSATLPGGGNPGPVLVTAGGAQLSDGGADVPPALDLRVTANGSLEATAVQATLDGSPLPLIASGAALTASVAPLPLGSRHQLSVMVRGYGDEHLGFTVVSATGAAAALHTDPAGVSVLDLSFQRAPDQTAVAAALAGSVPGAALHWLDADDLEATWSGTVARPLHLAASTGAAHGSHLAGDLSLDLRAVPAGVLRRAVVPAVGVAQAHPLVIGFAVGTAASHRSLDAHAGSLSMVSPTGWQAAGDGTLQHAPDAGAVAIADQHGLPVWPMLQNAGFDTAAVDALLDSGRARDQLVGALRREASVAGYDGVQLDFEAVNPDHMAQFTAFVVQLAQGLHGDGRKLAVDVVPHKPGHVNLYSGAYDLPAIAAAADVVVLMAYDQHTASTDPGPVAGADWDASVLEGSLPGARGAALVLGMPLYSRAWDDQGSGVADSYAAGLVHALAMPAAQVTYDFGAQTPEVHWTEGSGQAAQLWFDDADSLQRKMALGAARGMAGIAMWRLGFEDPALWEALPSPQR